MSFSKIVKNEILRNQINKEIEYFIIEGILLSIINFNSEKSDVIIRDENIKIFVADILEKTIINRDLATIIWKNNHLIISDYHTLNFEIIELLKNIELLKGEQYETLRYFLQGVFLLCGYIIEPQKYYQCEIKLRTSFLEMNLGKILEHFDIKYVHTNKEDTKFLKIADSESISDLLKLIKATNSLYQLEDIKIYKQYMNNVNRKVNSETSNINRQVEAAQESINAINILKSNGMFDILSSDIKEIALLRVENPLASLKEISIISENKYSKSKIVRALNKIILSVK